ncbi:MAG: coat protein, partial [Defluviitaleaceae bacterium]|nr:coat protein [Defluviitaleaceae bacterium]
DAKQLLGDAFGQLAVIVMHSAVYTELQKQDLITYIRPSSGTPFGEYWGYSVIVDDSTPFDPATGTYSTFLLAEGVIGRGDGTPVDFTQAETCRDGLKGEDYLIFRKSLILHPYGVSFVGNNVTGVSPTNAELKNGENWVRVFDNKNIGMLEIRHTVS